MIYKLIFEDGQVDYCTAKDLLHLLKEYDKEFELHLQEVENIIEISEDDAKQIKLLNPDYNEEDPDDLEYITLYDSAVGDQFCVVGSTEWV